MTKQKPGDIEGSERDLQRLLVESFESLRGSPAERRKFPALDRILSRIEARERRMAADESSWSFRTRWLVGPLTAAAAGFAGAALAMAIFGSAAPSSTPEVAIASQQPSIEASDDLDRSIRRLEKAVRGLEKFQPLLESRIEWVEDALQRRVKDAFVAADHREDSRRGPQPAVRLRSGDGV